MPEPPAPSGGPTPAQIAAAAHAAALQATAQRESAETVGETLSSGETPTSGDVLSSGEIVSSGDAVSSGDVVSSGEIVSSAGPVADQPQDGAAEVPAARKSRRRSSRSAKSPAVSVTPTAVPVTGQPVEHPVDHPVEHPVVVERSGEPMPDQPQVVAADVVAPSKSRRRSSRSAKSPAGSVTEQPVELMTETGRTSSELPATVAEPTPAAEASPAAPVADVAPVTAPPARHRHKRPRVVAPAGPPPGAGQPDVASGEFGS